MTHAKTNMTVANVGLLAIAPALIASAAYGAGLSQVPVPNAHVRGSDGAFADAADYSAAVSIVVSRSGSPAALATIALDPSHGYAHT